MKLLWLNLLMVALVSVFSFLGCGKGKPKEEEKKCSEITDSSDCTKNTKCLWQPGSSGPNGNNEEERANPNNGNGEEDFEPEGQDAERRVNPEARTAGKCIEKPAANNNNNGGRPEGPGHEGQREEGEQPQGAAAFIVGNNTPINDENDLEAYCFQQSDENCDDVHINMADGEKQACKFSDGGCHMHPDFAQQGNQGDDQNNEDE